MNDGSTLALWGLVVSIIGLACVLLFKGPKEVAKDMEVRVDGLEERHWALNTGFVEFRATMIGRLDRLTDAIEHLTDALEHLKLTTTGEHRVVRPKRGE